MENEKRKKKKNYNTPEYKVPPHFSNGRNNKDSQLLCK